MELVHKRQRFNRNAIASSRGAYVMHAHKCQLSENHNDSKSLNLFAAVHKAIPLYYIKCFGSLIPVDAERASMYPKDMVVIK